MAGMARKVLPVLLPLWAVIVTPTLCITGWLEHACAHAERSCPPHEGGLPSHDQKHEGTCKHEADCPADPCFQVVRPEDRTHGPSHLSAGVESAFPQLMADRGWHLSCGPGADATQPPNGHHLSGRPYADRDIPLLI